MIHFDLPKQKSSIIKVFGIGGGGSNAVNYMYSQNIEGVDFVVCNTDAKAIQQSQVNNKIQLGPASTQGLGAGANPQVGKTATEESLQEIKSILEVNTKMAFITAGMGGGTGTGGAPIVAQICKEMGILTVGIVTTPFSFEGPRRMQQAKEGIEALKPHVDTLLVINNDKLRMQYGNLKMKEAFSKADDVLATASKCITDIINSKGHIIVDFADVCTVMKNGGVAILGSAAVEGENRAQLAIEEALSSPLLNDNDIRGAKWILININSAEGDYECTMDEIDLINEFLRSQTGENTDVILGMGIDNSLDAKIGVTIIATGFHHKDPFSANVMKKPEPKVEKIMMTLGENNNTEVEAKVEHIATQQAIPFEDKNPYEPQLTTPEPQLNNAPEPNVENSFAISEFDLNREQITDAREAEIFELELLNNESFVTPFFGKVEEVQEVAKVEEVERVQELQNVEPTLQFVFAEKPKPNTTLLSKPANIYSSYNAIKNENIVAEKVEETKPENVFELSIKDTTPISEVATANAVEEKTAEENIIDTDLSFTITNKIETIVEPQVNNVAATYSEDLSEEELKRKRAVDRINTLRNLSFSASGVDKTNEFDNVPAYIRKKIELHGNAIATVENFYGRPTIDASSENIVNYSTKNTFLEGENPD